MPELPPEPEIEPPPKSADKLDIMSRNCSELKATLAVLQGQMNALTAEKKTQDTPVAEQAQPKKPKNKKNKANKSCPITERSAGGSKTVATNGKSNSNVTANAEDDVPINNENVPVEAVNGNGVEQNPDVESVPSNDNGDRQETEEIVKDLIDGLVKDVTTKCSLESQNVEDVPVQAVNGDNSSTTPVVGENAEPNTPLLVTELKTDEPVILAN